MVDGESGLLEDHLDKDQIVEAPFIVGQPIRQHDPDLCLVVAVEPHLTTYSILFDNG